jgi:hypothetical protein
MAAASYATNLSDIFTDGSTTGWTALGGGAAGLNQETDYYIQGTSCLSKNAFASDTKGMIYNYGSDAGGTPTDGAYLMWVTHLTPNSLDTIAGGGIRFLIGSGTGDYKTYYVGGSDTIEFGGWILAAVKEQTTGDETDTGTPSSTVEQYFGALWDLPTGGPTKGAPNGIDAIRFGRCDIVITDGDATPNGPATFSGILTNLETASNRYGLLAQIGGAWYNSGLLQFGSSGTAVYFIDANKTVFLRDHPHVTSNFNTWEVQNASSTVSLTNYSVRALGTNAPGRWVTTDNATVTLTTCNWTDMGVFGFNTNTTVLGNTFLRCAAVTHNGADMSESTISDPNVSANASGLIYDVAADPDGEMDNMTFEMGSTSTHAIEFGTNVPSTMTLRGCTFTGYGSGNNANDSTFHFKDTSGTITLNLVGCTGNASYRTDGATINIVNDPITVKITCQTGSGAKIQNARVHLRAADGTGPFPFEETVTIANSGTTATVTHTGHGLATNDYVYINGASLQANNGEFQITVSDANTYTYTMGSTPGSSPTGTITSTFVALAGLSDVNGVVSTTKTYSTDQPVTGWARKSSSSPYYAQGPINDTIDSVDGLSISAILISDE